jgi:transposase InsO family protein
MYMPHTGGYRYIVQARCSLTAWPEWRALRVETGRTIGAFIFEEILCRWGAVREIVTDNGSAYIAALDWLADRYGIRHIRILPYNSQANGIVERQHRTIRDSIFKACDGDDSCWPTVAPYAFWADRATTRKSTGFSPFYMAHGVEPVLPFDIIQAMFLTPNINKPLLTSDLLAIRARQLQKHPADLATIHDRILASRHASARQFEKEYANTMHDYNFAPGSLVLIRNMSLTMEKMKPRYLGPMIILRCTHHSAYRLAELDGAVSNLRYAAFRLVPYHAYSQRFIPVTHVVEDDDLASLELGHTTVSVGNDRDDELVTQEGQNLNPPGDVEMAYVLSSEMGSATPIRPLLSVNPPSYCVCSTCVHCPYHVTPSSCPQVRTNLLVRHNSALSSHASLAHPCSRPHPLVVRPAYSPLSTPDRQQIDAFPFTAKVNLAVAPQNQQSGSNIAPVASANIKNVRHRCSM